MIRTIYVIGDSTVVTGEDPYYGWGGQLAQFLPDVTIENHAVSGRSSKSFWDEGLFIPVASAMREGDLLLIAFGHNDEKDDVQRHTDPDSTFTQMLMRYVKAARSAGAVPVLCTSVSRNFFGDNQFLLYTHGGYPGAMRALCMKENIPLIDLEMETRRLLLSLGMDKACDLFVNIAPGTDDRFPGGVSDRTHFNIHGATRVASMVVSRLGELSLLDM